jgi:hypothetical protein
MGPAYVLVAWLGEPDKGLDPVYQFPGERRTKDGETGIQKIAVVPPWTAIQSYLVKRP